MNGEMCLLYPFVNESVLLSVAVLSAFYCICALAICSKTVQALNIPSSEGWAWPLYGILILPQIVPWTMLRQDANLRHASCEKCVADSDFDCASALRLLHFSCAGRHPWRRRSKSAPRAKTERRRV